MAHRYQDRPFPEDDDYGRDDLGATAPPEPDPLAELARLIGQTDPFGDVKRGAPMAPVDFVLSRLRTLMTTLSLRIIRRSSRRIVSHCGAWPAPSGRDVKL